MANINLDKFYINENRLKSSVDTRIQLNKTTIDKEYWGDLELDLSFNEIKERPLNAKESTIDLQRTINEGSVAVSLRNLFNTYSCSLLLNPEIDFNLSHYIFEPINTTSAWFLGYDIMQYLPLYEPRVIITGVNVIANANEALYMIKIKLIVPDVSEEEIEISSVLNQEGFSIIQ